MVFSAIQEIAAWFPSMSHAHHSVLQLQSMLPSNWTVVAQHISDPDIVANLQKAINNFIESGQVWALLIGLIIGYMIRGLSTYG